MGEDVTKKLREQIASMTTRDWLVRVSELRQAVENPDRVIAEQRRTIDRLHRLVDGERAKIARMEVEAAKSGVPRESGPTRRRKPDPTGGASS